MKSLGFEPNTGLEQIIPTAHSELSESNLLSVIHVAYDESITEEIVSQVPDVSFLPSQPSISAGDVMPEERSLVPRNPRLQVGRTVPDAIVVPHTSSATSGQYGSSPHYSSSVEEDPFC